MTITYLEDIERTVEQGKDVFGVSTGAGGKWEISASLEAIRKIAHRAAIAKKAGVSIMRLLPSQSMTNSTPLLIATKIGEEDNRGNPTVAWSTVETKEAAETLRDVSHGPSPYFALETEEVVNP